MRRKPILYTALGLVLGLAIAATPVQGHVGGTVAHLWKHLRPLTDARYFTRTASDSRYYTKPQSDGLYLRKSEGDTRYYRKSESDSRFVNVGEATLGTSKASGFGSVAGCSETSFSCKSSATATCLSGKVVGGGFSTSSDALYAVSSEPYFNGWRVEMGNLSTSFASFSVYAVCAST